MKRWGVIVLAVVVGGASWGLRAQDKKTETKEVEQPIRQLSWLQGGVWVADATKFAPGIQKIETRYEWADNHAYLRFTTHFVFDKGTMKNYDGNLYWDPQKNSLAIWYMDASGEITQGPMEWSGDLLRVLFHGPDFEGKIADLKVEVTRLSNQHYHWMVAEKQADSWKELGALDYLRQDETPPAKSTAPAQPNAR